MGLYFFWQKFKKVLAFYLIICYHIIKGKGITLTE
nr:MAG TPA: hypothetical protein [Caudoviricetes sp.]